MRGLWWVRRPVTAWVLAGLTLLLAAALVPLSLLARQNPLATGGPQIAVDVSFAAVGLVVARHRPGNPVGWLMLCLAAGLLFNADSGLYNVLHYRFGYRFPLAPAILFSYEVSEPLLGLLPLVILVFPDGRLPSPRWRWMLRGYLVIAVAYMVVLAQLSVYAVGRHRTQVDAGGQLALAHHSYQVVYAPVTLIFFAMWLLAFGYQIVSWRRAAGEPRQQRSWLMAGAAAALLSFAAAAVLGAGHGTWRTLSDIAVVGVAALPAGMGVAILKYRLYEIDRIISRTLAYAIVTGLLVGVYAGLVLLARQVLSVDSPVAVAGSTLAAAALFTPVRRRVQRVVDRRFNRVRYDADRMVEAFAVRLKDAMDLDMVQADLAGVVNQALEPAHVTVWTATDS
jgi:hypothetical protein